PRRATEWRSSSIANILQNEVYIGNIVYNKSVGNKKPSKSKTRVITPYRRLPEEEWRRVYNAHQPLYSREEFDRIKQYFESNVKSHKGSEVRTYALTGLCKTPDGKTLRVTQGKKGT
ncbi:recombinase family protein, partial [Staphylococcus haemolyticus]